EPPAVLRRAVDGVLDEAVEVDLEPGAVDDRAGREESPEGVGMRVLLPQPRRLGEDHGLGDLGTQVVPVADRGRDEPSAPAGMEGHCRTSVLVHGICLPLRNRAAGFRPRIWRASVALTPGRGLGAPSRGGVAQRVAITPLAAEPPGLSEAAAGPTSRRA